VRRPIALALAAVSAAAVVAAPRQLGGGEAAAAPAARPTVTIRMGEFFFRPRLVTVHVGQAVRFVNVGRIQHTVADTDRRWDVRSRLIRPRPLGHGAAQIVRFARTGTVYYLCTFHPTLMRGRIVVVP
jgi:plastocyanin